MKLKSAAMAVLLSLGGSEAKSRRSRITSFRKDSIDNPVIDNQVIESVPLQQIIADLEQLNADDFAARVPARAPARKHKKSQNRGESNHGQERQIHPRMKRAEAWKPFRDEKKRNSDFNNVEFRVFDEIENLRREQNFDNFLRSYSSSF